MSRDNQTFIPDHPLSESPMGVTLLHDPTLNKGTAFTDEERDRYHLRGLLPPRVLTLEQQLNKVLESFRSKPSDLEKYIYLISLQDRNERLFYRFVMSHMSETMPIIYTPTVGQACQKYAHLFRRSRGLFLSAKDRGRMARVMRNWPTHGVRIIVITDGERILGLGDLGANGMGIPVGKLSLYTACAGVHPSWCLPVTLDVGTENEAFRNDPLYIGLPQRRLRGQDYDSLVEEFMQGVREVFPRAVVQFEDFGNTNAFRVLRKYRDEACCFNDDIQGTAGVTLAGLWSALRMTGKRPLGTGNLLFLGAGEAGTGIADLLVTAMMKEGLSEADARRRCWFVDSKGLVIKSRTDLQEHKVPYAQDHAPVADLLGAVQAIKPYALIGVSGQPQTFTQPIVRAMSAINERPIIFALSNPTSQSECTAEQAYTWSDGRAVFASGSPFPTFQYQGRTFVPGQANNAFVFPGVGLGVIASGARRVTDEMFMTAARTLADMVSEADLATGCTFPPLDAIRDVSAQIAAAVAKVAIDRGLATEQLPSDLLRHIQALVYQPTYQTEEVEVV